MIKLTEDMVIARTRISDLASIKKLNCWGADLEDVSLLRKMPNVEVLALSVNSIKTLMDFQNCYGLQELYIRKNNITDLRDVCYLKGLPNLKSLWLADNPCTQVEGYRLAVIKALPQLEKLDDIIIKPDETDEANRAGLDLLLPVQGQETNVASNVSVNRLPTPVESLPNNSTPAEEEFQRVPDYQSLSTRSRSVTPQLVESEEAPKPRTITEQIIQQTTPEAPLQRRKQSTTLPQMPSPQHVPPATPSESLPSSRRASTASFSSLQNADYCLPEYSLESVKEFKCPVHSGTQTESLLVETSKIQTPSAFRSYNYAPPPPPATPLPQNDYYSGGYQEQQQQQQQQRVGDSRSQTHFADSFHRNSSQQYAVMSPANSVPPSNYAPPPNQGTNSEKSSPTRTRNRTKTSNLLMATLCLVNELDYGSLEVVAMAVRNRLDELDES